jgi:multiple sugar transport system substrate-binding protein
MRRLTICVLMAAVATACSGGSSGSSSKSSAPASAQAITLKVWVQWTDSDFDQLRAILDDYEHAHPGIKIDAVPGQGDATKLTEAVATGNGPDLANVADFAHLGKLCDSGVLTDLAPQLPAAGISPELFAKAAQPVLDTDGKTCALPYLADTFGLYYNTDLFAAAGINGPPKTMSELADLAKKLTTHAADGTIDVAGFVPLVGFYENYDVRYAAAWGAHYFDAAGKSSLAADPEWAALLRWVKDLVDFYGYDELQRFASGAGDEFSAANAFENGKLAMVLDGEWRPGIIAREHPELHFAAAPLPAPDGDQSLYGAAQVAIGLLGVPKGAAHPAEALALAKYLAVETGPLVRFANAIHNVPTTAAALASPDLALGEPGKPFVAALANPRSSYPDII